MSIQYLDQPNIVTIYPNEVISNNIIANNFKSNDITIDASVPSNTVSQISSPSEAVTLNTESGYINMFSGNYTGGVTAFFTLNNSHIKANDVLTIQSVKNTTTLSVIMAGSNVTGAGTATIAAFFLGNNSGTVKLYFQIKHV
jgi:hypothetical protein